MRGRLNHDFITNINKQFICLIVTVMQYCLKSWSTGAYINQDRFRGITPKSEQSAPRQGGLKLANVPYSCLAASVGHLEHDCRAATGGSTEFNQECGAGKGELYVMATAVPESNERTAKNQDILARDRIRAPSFGNDILVPRRPHTPPRGVEAPISRIGGTPRGTKNRPDSPQQ